VFLQRLGAAATWLCRNASGLLKALCPKHYHTGAEFVSFGHLATRRTGLDRFDHSCTQVVGIRPRHRSPPQNRINAARLARRQTLGNPPDSIRAKYALTTQAAGCPASPSCRGWWSSLSRLIARVCQSLSKRAFRSGRRQRWAAGSYAPNSEQNSQYDQLNPHFSASRATARVHRARSSMFASR